ncbi:hypothetical protein KY290_037103 [Solanum tuberosum]|uniref:Uncharacterized protein n=1 Tax=Solanum tuberosum TaxID=4113 RepID=A0ABQ7TW13_SOLTU|nr:hypothetical protein KY284_036451 [Solanum tuberosum]KAH0636710.1 hypothetical protein KY289_036625 [Solanum tuberosum]KAH0639840.1 hypothetical protein KY285_036426 [Solanum tuberosum]KAH0738398.1 hypothetical protein KY290_037103 [Solanum tuberosum]
MVMWLKFNFLTLLKTGQRRGRKNPKEVNHQRDEGRTDMDDLKETTDSDCSTQVHNGPHDRTGQKGNGAT